MSKVPTRNPQLIRQLTLLGLLGRGRWSLDRLAQELGVTTRTIRRDLAGLEEAHIPISNDVDGRRGVTQKVYWSVFDWRKAGAVQLEVFDSQRQTVQRVPDPEWERQAAGRMR